MEAVCAEHGCHRGRGGTAKLKSYGHREINAFHKLVERGYVERTGPSTSHIEYVRGWGCTSYTHTGKITELGQAYIAKKLFD